MKTSLFAATVLCATAVQSTLSAAEFQAGAATSNITPDIGSEIVGGFVPFPATYIHDELHARCLVLDDGKTKLALVVCDLLGISRVVSEEARRQIAERHGIPPQCVLISATHTHSAASALGKEPRVLDQPADDYQRFVARRIADAVTRAIHDLRPAQLALGTAEAPEHVFNRRWHMRPGTIPANPFGGRDLVKMNPPRGSEHLIEPAGPVDPTVSFLAVRQPNGRPIGVFAAYSLHYVGGVGPGHISADYFAVFSERLKELQMADWQDDPDAPPFVAIMANGTSGDAYIRDYSRKAGRKFDRFQVADAVAQVAFAVYQSMEFHDRVPLAMAERELTLGVREPKLDWARKVLAEAQGEPLKTRSQVYAREQVLLSEMPPTRTIKLQALRIGGLGIAGIPAEVFAITGLKVRERSPIQPTFTISMANGWHGYLPPPEQMSMGGYTTWLARSSCLEAEAEPKIVAVVTDLLDEVAGDARRERPEPPPGPYAAAVLASKPAVYWRLEEMNGPHAVDAVRGKPRGTFETQIAYAMPGPRPDAFAGFEPGNRAPHFVGQRMEAAVEGLAGAYTAELWFRNSMPVDVRPITAYLFSVGPADAADASGEHLAIGGTEAGPGKLVFHTGDRLDEALVGTTEVPLRNWVPRESWHHVAVVREGDGVAVY
ncbi:MAG: neutral/alkaline non-lysosomal ceramidase N-terminal domain-containing protein, partial [Pirellulales bacterium]